MSLNKHLFICTSCKDQNGEEGIGLQMQQDLKSYIREEHSEKSVRVNKSGCLGKCNLGINAVCYPEEKWFSKLSKKDTEILKNELIGE